MVLSEIWGIVLYADDPLIFTECKTCKKCYERIKKDTDNINNIEDKEIEIKWE